MKYLKKIIIWLIVIEFLNLVVGFVYKGSNIFLPYSKFNAPPLYYDMDSLYGVTRQKKSIQLLSYPWGDITYETNSLGFRDEEFDQNGILVVGNSFVEGFGVKTEERFTEILEKRLNIPFHNTGSGGVWTAIQSVTLLENFMKKNRPKVNKVVLILTPGEIVNIDTRKPTTDPNRNYPYKQGEFIKFYKSDNNIFKNQLSLIDKVKRFSKSLLVSKIYMTFKYYGASKSKNKPVSYNKQNLDWLISKINHLDLKIDVDIILINNLGRTKILEIEKYTTSNSKVKFHVIEFPDKLDNYFISNGHLNAKGNEELVKLLLPVLQ